MISKDLLKILACPSCKFPLKEFERSLICTNVQCKRRYPVKDNIPVMLIDSSEVLSDSDYHKALQS